MAYKPAVATVVILFGNSVAIGVFCLVLAVKVLYFVTVQVKSTRSAPVKISVLNDLTFNQNLNTFIVNLADVSVEIRGSKALQLQQFAFYDQAGCFTVVNIY